ncbi:L,D-transpeptidase [Alkalihalobacterium elongatum]|uniref:L,D-transpeptidase n=1 Tax=Alkalihalobacterium elongatum TaxID=2675466 RepID=UPI002E2A7E49|nr:L,D-transpeptidase [Alkalihalobacterium elongatum]
MGYAVEQSVEKNNLPLKRPIKWYKKWKYILSIIIFTIAIILAALIYYQNTHFNSNITINGIEVNGLTASQALEKLQTSTLKNEIYVGDQLILDGTETKMVFTDSDLPEIKGILKKQSTFFPSTEAKTYSLVPSKLDEYRHGDLRTELEQTLIDMNDQLIAPVNAQAILEDGEIIVSESIDGEQYDVFSILDQFDNHDYTSEIYLEPIYLEPIKEDSELVQNQVNKLQDFLQHTIDYKVEDQVYSLKASDVIISASVSEDMDVIINAHTIQDKVAEINDSQSTLGKDFTFKTHSGSVISIKGQGYGWALNVKEETTILQEAFETGETAISASNIYGNGWSGEGYGYGVTANNGIGHTYAEVSIAEQRMWIYREGELVLTTHVVTGDRSKNQDTLRGVWYILFKRTPYTLTSDSYAIDVDYWAPFTNSGQGFHDADWRSNWSSTAYHNQGSNGCVNVPPSVMKKVYDNLRVYDPVVIY